MELSTILEWWPLILATAGAVKLTAVLREKIAHLEASHERTNRRVDAGHKEVNERVDELKRDLAAQRAEDLAREAKQFDEVKAKLDRLIELSLRG